MFAFHRRREAELARRLELLEAALDSHGLRIRDPYVAHMSALAELTRARGATGTVGSGVLGANTALNLGATTALVTVNVWLTGSYLALGWMTGDNATVAGACDIFPTAVAGTTLAAAIPSASCEYTATAANATFASFAGLVTVTATPATTAPQGINQGAPGAPGGVVLTAFAAGGTTGARARATSLVNAQVGATGLTLVQVD